MTLNCQSYKGILNINFKNKQQDVYFGSSTELEKHQLIIELKDKELVMKDRENENLSEIIALLKKQTTTTET